MISVSVYLISLITVWCLSFSAHVSKVTIIRNVDKTIYIYLKATDIKMCANIHEAGLLLLILKSQIKLLSLLTPVFCVT